MAEVELEELDEVELLEVVAELELEELDVVVVPSND